MPTWQWGGELGSATKQNLCFSQEVDYRKDVDAWWFISGILPQERADRVVYQKNLPNKQGTSDSGPAVHHGLRDKYFLPFSPSFSRLAVCGPFSLALTSEQEESPVTFSGGYRLRYFSFLRHNHPEYPSQSRHFELCLDHMIWAYADRGSKRLWLPEKSRMGFTHTLSGGESSWLSPGHSSAALHASRT